MFSIYYPVRPFIVTQHFAGNIPCVKDFGKPVQSIVDGKDNFTCPVGYKKLYSQWGMEGHNGTDCAAGVQSVYAAASGTVIEQQTVPSRGLGLGILTDTEVDLECGKYFAKLRYWHLKSFSVNVGDHVGAGQLIGFSDNTGYSSGNHLHFELQPMDKDKGGHPRLTNPKGHIAGAVSLEPYLNGEYAADIQLPPDTSVTFETALALLRAALAGKALADAEAVLRKKYGR